MNDLAQSPQDLVAGPAKWFRIYAWIAIVLSIIGAVMNLLGVGASGMEGDDQMAALNAMSGAVGVVFNLLAVALGFMTLKAAKALEGLENRTFVMIFAVVAMLPCLSGCCLIGLPVGIWVLVVMNKPEVKDAFTS